MSSREILEYFDATAFRKTREDLELAVQLVQGPRVAIDCGCGAGSDIAFLRSKGFTVYAFDIEQAAIERCRNRFRGDGNVLLSHASFRTFDYPDSSLIAADASLFFCPEDQFDLVWQKMQTALLPDGIFVGSFLGPEDTMAGPDYDKEAFWPDILVTSEERIRLWFKSFEIVSLKEHSSSGAAFNGKAHHWNIYTVLAKKKF